MFIINFAPSGYEVLPTSSVTDGVYVLDSVLRRAILVKDDLRRTTYISLI